MEVWPISIICISDKSVYLLEGLVGPHTFATDDGRTLTEGASVRLSLLHCVYIPDKRHCHCCRLTSPRSPWYRQVSLSECPAAGLLLYHAECHVRSGYTLSSMSSLHTWSPSWFIGAETLAVLQQFVSLPSSDKLYYLKVHNLEYYSTIATT